MWQDKFFLSIWKFIFFCSEVYDSFVGGLLKDKKNFMVITWKWYNVLIKKYSMYETVQVQQNIKECYFKL